MTAPSIVVVWPDGRGDHIVKLNGEYVGRLYSIADGTTFADHNLRAACRWEGAPRWDTPRHAVDTVKNRLHDIAEGAA